MARLRVCRTYEKLPSIKKLAKNMVSLKNGKDKMSHLNKDPEVSNKQGDSANKESGSQMNKSSHLNKESGVHIEQGVSNEQELSPEQGIRGPY